MSQMTWKQFKDKVESQNVNDNTLILWIDVATDISGVDDISTTFERAGEVYIMN